jgi:hypothetical protein
MRRLDWGALAARALPVWFGVISVLVVNATIVGGGFGIDTRIYRLAALEALSGGDPWQAQVGSFAFAAPPPTVIGAVPLALVPEGVAVVGWALVLAGAAVLTVRLLHLPFWWVAFPPIVDSVVVGNPDVLVIALLAAGTRAAGGLATLLKIYALVPLIALRKWEAIGLGTILLALSLPLWPTFLSQLPEISETLRSQSRGGYSAFGTILLVPTLLALLLLDRRSIGWLFVPAVWPYSQFHYACIAIPALGVASAYAMAVPIHGMPALVVVGIAIARLRATLAGRPEPGLGPIGRLIGRRARVPA